MTLLILLAALFVERVVREYRPKRTHRWFDRYCQMLSQHTALRWLLDQPLGPALALLPPLAVIGWLQLAFDDLGGLFVLVFGTLILVYSLGPRDLSEDAAAFIDARDAGDEDGANAAASTLCLGESAPTEEPRRTLAVARAIVVRANTQVVGPLFWFTVFGPVGAAAYRTSHLLREYQRRQEESTERARHSELLCYFVDWLPARVTAAGYALAGRFDAAAHAWRSYHLKADDRDPAEAAVLLAQTGLAALDTFPSDADELEDAVATSAVDLIPPIVEDAVALVWRSIAVWVGLVAAGTLIAALA